MDGRWLGIALVVTLVGCSGGGEGGHPEQGNDQNVTSAVTYACTSKDPFAPGSLRLSLQKSAEVLLVHRLDGSAPDDTGSFDPAFKPRVNKNFAKFADFDSDNDDPHSPSTTTILLEKPLLSGAASGTVKHQFRDEHAGFIESVYQCSKALT